ncbi:MAG: hypothetical protein PVF91_04360 [Chromatiales bacterium]
MFVDRQLDFRLVLGLTSRINAPPQKKADEPERGITKLVNQIKRSEMYRKGTIAIAGAGAVSRGATVADRIDQVQSCRV